MTFGDTTITSGGGLYSPGGYSIGTDIYGKKYLTIEAEKSFGLFEYGTSNYHTTDITEAQKQAYASAEYCLQMFSYDNNTNRGTFTTVLRTNTGYSDEVITIDRHDLVSGYGFNMVAGSPRTFSLVTEAGTDPIRIYDIMIFPDEYMTSETNKFTERNGTARFLLPSGSRPQR